MAVRRLSSKKVKLAESVSCILDVCDSSHCTIRHLCFEECAFAYRNLISILFHHATITYLINLPIENVVPKALGAPELSVQTQRATYLKCDPSFYASQYSDYCPASFLIFISFWSHKF